MPLFKILNTFMVACLVEHTFRFCLSGVPHPVRYGHAW